MDVRALDPSLQQSTAVGLGSIAPLRPQSSEVVAETTTRHRPRVHSAASVGRLGIRRSSLRCNGEKRMASITPQKTAPWNGHRIAPNAIVTRMSSNKNALS